MKLSKLSWALAFIFAILFFITISPYKISVVKSPSFIINTSTPSAQLTNIIEADTVQSKLEIANYLTELSKNNIERTDKWFSTMLNIVFAAFSILAVAFAIVGISLMDKFKMIDKLHEDSKKTNEEIKDRFKTQHAETNSKATETLSTETDNVFKPEDQKTTESTTTNKSSDEVMSWVKLYHFERTHRLIFGSQLTILRTMYSNDPSYSVNTALMQAIHRRSKWTDINFDDYIGFLINSSLIKKREDADEYFLTQLGGEFISYLFKNNMSEKLE